MEKGNINKKEGQKLERKEERGKRRERERKEKRGRREEKSIIGTRGERGEEKVKQRRGRHGHLFLWHCSLGHITRGMNVGPEI